MIRKSPPTLVQQRHAWHCMSSSRDDGVPIIRAFIDYAAIIIQALIGDISKDTKDASLCRPGVSMKILKATIRLERFV